MRRMALLLLGSGSLLLVQCTPVLQGEKVDVATLGAPDLLSAPVVPAAGPTPASMPPLAAGAIRAWIPRAISPNGDVVEGHYLDISPTAPRQEMVPPDKPMPRPPKGIVPQATAAKRKPPESPVPPPMDHRPPPLSGTPGFPGGSGADSLPRGGGYEPMVP